MDGISNQSRPRRGFTLVEMLAVVVIIAILASLITAAAIPARRRAQIAGMAMELAQLDMAVRAYKERFGEFPPDFAVSVSTDAGKAVVLRHLAKAFPRYAPAGSTIAAKWASFRTDVQSGWGVDVNRLCPGEAITFWLGGRPIWSAVDPNIPVAGFDGFSANPKNPFDNGSSRIGPFFEFDPVRVGTPWVEPRYWPPYGTYNETYGNKSYGAITYFRADNGGYTGKHWDDWTYPYRDSRTGGWVNPRSFQILTSGMDSMFANDDDVGNEYYLFPTYPTAGTYVEYHHDDMSNFTSGTMEDAMP